jgi:hypothetical protein
MKLKKFESYSMDIDNGDISTEYAKLIISKFIDDETIHNGSRSKILEQIYVDIIKGDNIEEQADIIKNEMISYLEYLIKFAEKIRPLYEIEAEKYNL